jgi:hypothetical protein
MSRLQNSRDPARADFDWRNFGQSIRVQCSRDGRSQWAIAEEIGITESDLSRVRGGQMVSVGKAIACARWLGEPLEKWYLPPLPCPMESTSCSGSNVKHRAEDGAVDPRDRPEDDGPRGLGVSPRNLHELHRMGR